LDKTTLRSILTEPKNSLIRQYKKLFELEGIQLSMDAAVLDFMVDKAVEFKLGARGLRSICESILTDAMFELPSARETKLHLDIEYARNKFDKSKMNLLKVA
jgi:ATP-dependent Clp protease ATP-binding subunit ClpX